MIGLTQWIEIFPPTLRQAQGERKNFTQSMSEVIVDRILKVRFKLKVNDHPIDMRKLYHRHPGRDCRDPEHRDVVECAYVKTAQK